MTDRASPSLPAGSLTLLLAIYWLALWVGTHLPAEHLPGAIDAWDKAVHLAAYAGLAMLLAGTLFVFGIPPRRIWLPLFLLLALHGAVDEWTQGWVPGRQPDPWDFLADLLGASAGLAVLVWATRGSRRPSWTSGENQALAHRTAPAPAGQLVASPPSIDTEG